jgi:dihydroflavonol-4-reductase
MSREGLRSETFQFFETWAVLVDNSKAQRELGIQHRPLEEGVRASLDGGLKQQGMDRPLDSTPTP